MNSISTKAAVAVLAVLCAWWYAPRASAASLDEVNAALADLRVTVGQAKAAGHQTLYGEIPLILQKRFEADWNDAKRRDHRKDWADFFLRNIIYETAYLKGLLAGKPDVRKVPPHPDHTKFTKKDNYFLLDRKPVLLVTTRNSGGEAGDDLYASPNAIYGIVSGVGATRYDYQNTPIWEVYQKDPKSHRVFDGGWCGHIIKDRWSIGGQGGRAGVCVISLDYPPMLEAVRKSIIAKARRFKSSARAKTARIISMDWEFTYQNYDDPTKVKWQNWLKEHYKTIDALNRIWKTDLASFDEITLPSKDWHAEKNPAKYYDFGEFNLWRFTDYLLWARKVIEKEVPGYPITAGGGSPFSQNFAKNAVDEEYMMLRGAIDVFLSETGSRSWGTAIVFDLQHSMEPKAMIHDPEYHSTGGYMPQMFLHGASSIDFYNWNSKGVNLSLPDGYATLRGCLEVRRLPEFITAFPKDVPQAAILYSRASLIQRHPGASTKQGKRGWQSPYVLEVQKCYRAGAIQDTPIGFVTSRQARLGIRRDLKVLVLPCMYFANRDVVKAIMTYVEEGGTVVVTPTSLVADEFNRRRDYLAEMGISIDKEVVPRYLARRAKPGVIMRGSEYDFIQGPIAPTEVQDEPTATLTWKQPQAAPGKTLAGRGIRQVIKVSGRATVLATYPDGTPAIIAKKIGQGEIIYLAMALEEPSMSDLFDWVYERAGVKRLVRATDPHGKRISGLETRMVPFKDGYLAYVYNMTESSAKVLLKPTVRVGRVENLDLVQAQDLSRPFDVGPYEFFIFKLSK